MMSKALTITDAAEIFEPSFSDTVSENKLPASKPEKGIELSLDDAASLLAERFGGEPVKKAKKQADITVEQAATKIADPAADVAAAIPSLRSRREDTTLNRQVVAGEYEHFLRVVNGAFAGHDEATLQASAEFRNAYEHARQLEAKVMAAAAEEHNAWIAECEMENAAFTARAAHHPEWNGASQERIADFLLGTGLPHDELLRLWQTPEAIAVGHPVCFAILSKVAGSDKQQDFIKVLHEVGFDDDEIEAVSNGNMSVHLHDHRIQELVARAAHADAPGQDQKAA
jgi:hypothetical protein